MRIFLLFVCSFFGLILQDTVFNVLSVAGGKPDFVLILVVFFSIFRGSAQGGTIGLLLGLMEDLMLGRFIGINTLCKGIIGYLVGITEKNLYKDNFLVPIISLLIASIANSALYFMISNMIGSNIGLNAMIMTTIPNTVYNMCFAPILYAVFYHIYTSNLQND